jgi:hypothetical protein
LGKSSLENPFSNLAYLNFPNIPRSVVAAHFMPEIKQRTRFSFMCRMQNRNLTQQIAELRRQLLQLRNAMAAATRDGNVLQNARLTLQACQLRRQLVEAQSHLFY